MKYRTVFACFLLVLTILSTSYEAAVAREGTASGGGGDPDAVEFLVIAEKILKWAESHPGVFDVPLTHVQQALDILSNSLNDHYQTGKPDLSKLIFLNDSIFVARYGSEKPARFFHDKGQIQKLVINRGYWKTIAEKEKYVLTSQEISGLAWSRKRYDIGKVIRESFDNDFRVSLIANIPPRHIECRDFAGNKIVSMEINSEIFNQQCVAIRDLKAEPFPLKWIPQIASLTIQNLGKAVGNQEEEANAVFRGLERNVLSTRMFQTADDSYPRNWQVVLSEFVKVWNGGPIIIEFMSILKRQGDKACGANQEQEEDGGYVFAKLNTGADDTRLLCFASTSN